jgi:hypothetical protein
MIDSDGLYFGWSRAGTVPAFLEDGADIVAMYPLALITCVDSDHSPLSMALLTDELATTGVDWRTHGTSILLNCADLPALADALFNGFDAVWFLQQEPAVLLPPPINATSDRPVPDRLPLGTDGVQELVRWMNAQHCTLGIGDGVGLNYFTTDPDLAGDIERLYHAWSGL